uniref:Uncharacterized protein n=1 Tax=Tanacetum cinerariifolium TaxID=118510 RepID=A0A699KCT6_TANCI|nr:hypothetical protein [Tanacetum cinerariifolium]
MPQILLKEAYNFAPLVTKIMVTKSLEHEVLTKVSSQPKSTYEAVAFLIKFDLKNRGLKKRKTSKGDNPTKGLKAKESKSGSSKGTKSQSKSSGKSVHVEESEFGVADSEMPQDQEENLGDDDDEPKRKVVSKHD